MDHTESLPIALTARGKSRAANRERATAFTVTNFAALPPDSLVRKPVVQCLYGIGETTLWKRTRAGKIPAPILIDGVCFWTVGAIRKSLASIVSDKVDPK